MKKNKNGLLFTNLIEFDMMFGHRNDPFGYAKALEEFDASVPDLMNKMKEDDMLIITADHGCAPATTSTDHSREYVPLLVYENRISQCKFLGIRKTFADIGATIADNFCISPPKIGSSFLKDINGRENNARW